MIFKKIIINFSVFFVILVPTINAGQNMGTEVPNLYHKPANKTIHINNSNSKAIERANIKIENINGQTVYNDVVFNESIAINTRNFVDGLHVVSIEILGLVLKKNIMILH